MNLVADSDSQPGIILKGDMYSLITHYSAFRLCLVSFTNAHIPEPIGRSSVAESDISKIHTCSM